MTERDAYVYALLEPWTLDACTDAIRYIGKSIHPWKRRNQHVIYALHVDDDNPLREWIRSIAPMVPNLVVLSAHESDAAAYDREIAWISYYRGLGADLLNLSDGGEGSLGVKLSDEAKARIGEVSRKYGADPEWRKFVSEQTKKAIAAKSDEAKQAHYEAIRRALEDPDIRWKMGSFLRGKKRPRDAVEKTAAAHRGMTRSDETRANISRAKKGKQWSEKMRKVMTEGERWCAICGAGPFRGEHGLRTHMRVHK